MTRRIVFVGERRSPTAVARGWSWADGRLAARPLFEALEAMGLRPGDHEFVNLYTDPPARPRLDRATVAKLRAPGRGRVVVALGKLVSDGLAKLGIDHVALVHPAARGRIRKRERYVAHVASKLGPALC